MVGSSDGCVSVPLWFWSGLWRSHLLVVGAIVQPHRLVLEMADVVSASCERVMYQIDAVLLREH